MQKEHRRTIAHLLEPLRLLLRYLVFAPLEIIFSPLGAYLVHKERTALSSEIKSEFHFLFSEYGGHIVPNEGPLGKYLCITIAVGNLLLRFYRGMGQSSIYVAPKDRPEEWHELSLVLSLIDPPIKIERGGLLWTGQISETIRGDLASLFTSLSEANYLALRARLSEVYRDDALRRKELDFAINNRLR